MKQVHYQLLFSILRPYPRSLSLLSSQWSAVTLFAKLLLSFFSHFVKNRFQFIHKIEQNELKEEEKNLRFLCTRIIIIIVVYFVDDDDRRANPATGRDANLRHALQIHANETLSIYLCSNKLCMRVGRTSPNATNTQLHIAGLCIEPWARVCFDA